MIRKTNAQRVKSIHRSVRKYGSQVIAMCHHTGGRPAPGQGPAMRRTVAHVRMATTIKMTWARALNRWSCCVVRQFLRAA